MPSTISAPPPTGVLAACADAAFRPLIVSPSFKPTSASGTKITIVPVAGSYELFGSAVFALPAVTNRPSTPPLVFGAATYDWKVGWAGIFGSNHIRTPWTAPSGVLKEANQYEPGACGFAPGSVSSWNRTSPAPLVTYGCEISSEWRSVPGVPVRLSPDGSVRIVGPGAVHG